MYAFLDADDREDRKSTTGYCTFIGGNLVTWTVKSKMLYIAQVQKQSIE